jgi:fatty-acyl-CoA synthase
MQTWSELVEYHAARRPDSPFVSDPACSATYEQMRRRLACRATWLADRGVGPGDRVAVLGRNSLVLVEVLLACQHLGAIAVPLNHRLAAVELAYMVGHSGSRLVAADPEFSGLAQGAAAEHAVPVAVFRGVEDLGGLAERAAAGADGDDICRIVYTSGTTSRPKGVTLTNRNIYVKSVSQAREFGLSYIDRGLIVGPLFHIAAFDVTLTTATYAGGSVHILPKFDARQTLSVILADRVTHVWLAPVMMRRVLDVAEELAVVCEHGPRLIIGGGEPTPPDLNERIVTVFPNSWYANVYGLTETSTGDTILPAAQTRIRPGSVGLPVAEAEVLIVDKQWRPCPPGVTGQVAIGGEKLSPGYWDDPAATAASWHGQLFLTGDAGYFDDGGFLFLTGRFKDMIISGGENIAAAEIEGVLLDHPAITDAAVVGRPDPQWGEVPVAFVVAKVDGVLADDLENHCRTRLARLKVPKEFHLLDSLPRTSIGKVQKGQLRTQAQELWGHGHGNVGGENPA